jgi:hypothetical protein
MIYVSIDIETSGLNPENNNVLSIGAIIEDTSKKLPFLEIPKFNAIILQNEITGSPRAIGMNSSIIDTMGRYLESNSEERSQIELAQTGIYGGGYNFYEKDEVVKEFYSFLWNNGFSTLDSPTTHINGKLKPVIDSRTKPITINVAGKNFGTFDKLFLQQLPWWQKLIRVRQRVLDPAILFVDWENDDSLPSLSKCKERVGLDTFVTHNALDDAWDVIEILRNKY